MKKLLAIVGTVAVGSLLLWAQQASTPPKSEAPPAEYKIPAAAKAQPNPVKATPESLAAGKKQYEFDCAMCHGKDGDGKGDLAGDSKAKVTNFTDPASLKDRTDGELFYILKNGKGEMPPEGSRVKDDGLWNMVNYIRAFAKTTGQ